MERSRGKALRIAAAMILAGGGSALAQAAQPPAQLPSLGGNPPAVMGATGTMYDGDNAQLTLPGGLGGGGEGAKAGPEAIVAGIPPTAATENGAQQAMSTQQTGGEH